MDKEARERARQYLLEARKTVEAALAQARAAVNEATAKEARRMVEEAIERTDEKDEGKKGWVNLEELRRKKKAPSVPRTTDDARRTAVSVSSEVSLRGLTIDEAEPVLQQALDGAILADLPHLRVIHGKGTGAMRDFVQGVLGRDPRIKRFGFAPANQGGDGVTVAEFA